MIQALEERLSRPSPADIACMSRLRGDVLILGGSGKMGPSLARLCRRAADAAGAPRRILAVSRTPANLPGVDTVACDLLDRAALGNLPDCPNILYLVGRKFGSSGNPDLTWAMNAIAPAWAAERFPQSRFVVFSTGNVYAPRPHGAPAPVEADPPEPVGEYGQSCLGRERIFEYFSRRNATPCLIFRLNYAVDLRYGVLVDIARAVWDRRPVSLRVPAFNVVWQRDANSYALRSLELCQSPARSLNVTGPETLLVRECAEFFARRFHRPCVFDGPEGPTSLLSDASVCRSLLGPPEVSAPELMEMVASWIESGGPGLDKPTHFEVADGRF